MADIIGYAGQIIEVIKAVHDVYLRIKGVAKEIDEAMDDCGIMKTDVMDLKKLFNKHTPSKFPDQVKIITQEFKSLNKSMKKLKKLFREYEKISQTLFGKTVWAYNKPRESILEIRSNFASYRTLFAKAMQIINEGHNQDMDRQMKEMRELAKKRDEERKREHAETKRKLKAMDEGRRKDAERFEALIKELIAKNQATPENRAGVMEGWLVSEKGMNREEARSCASTALREGRVPSIKIEKEEPKKVNKEVKKGGDVAAGKDSKSNGQEAKAKPKPSTTPAKDKSPSPTPLKKDNEKEKEREKEKVKDIPKDVKAEPVRLAIALGIFGPLNADIVASTNTAGKTIKLLKSRDPTTDLQFASQRSRLTKIEKAVAEHGYQVLSIVNDSGRPCLELKGSWKDNKTNAIDKGLKEPALPKLTPVSKDAKNKTPYHADNGKVVEVAKNQHHEPKKPEHEHKPKTPSPSPAPAPPAKNKPQSPPPKNDNKSTPNVAPKTQKPKVPVILVQEPRNSNAKSTLAPKETPKNNNTPTHIFKNNNTSNSRNTHSRPPSPTPSAVSHIATNGGYVKRANSVTSVKSAASQKERIENGMRHVKEGEKRGRSLDPPHSSAHSSSQLNLGLGAQGRSKSQVAYTNGQEGRRRGSEESERVLYERRLGLDAGLQVIGGVKEGSGSGNGSKAKSEAGFVNGKEGRRRGSEESERILYERRLGLGT